MLRRIEGGYNRHDGVPGHVLVPLPALVGEERVAAYVIREHDRGRDLAEILEDRYVQNRLTPDQRARLLDRPEVIKAIGNDTIADARHSLTT